MARKRRIVRNFNEHTETESQLAAARVALDNVLRSFDPPNTEGSQPGNKAQRAGDR